MKKNKKQHSTITVGMDLGDRMNHLYILHEDEENGTKLSCPATQMGIAKALNLKTKATVVIEAGTHSPWVSRLIKKIGHDVVVANPRQLNLIAKNNRKSDQTDAELLAKLGRANPKLLSPIRHRSEKAQTDLVVLRSRDTLVSTRTGLINCVRGQTKSFGIKLPAATTTYFAKKVRALIPAELQPAIEPLLVSIEAINANIKQLDHHISHELPARYPEIQKLSQVPSVGPITAAVFTLTIDDPKRFKRSRSVGSYLGLVPKKDQSGDKDPEMHITHAGDEMLRRLLVGCAQHIIGPFGQDSDLRRFGIQLASKGRKAAKRRAVVAVARKLAVLLHRLMITEKPYEALYQHRGAPQMEQINVA